MASYIYNTLGDAVDEAFSILAVDGDTNSFPGLSRSQFESFANRFNKQFIDAVRLRTREGTSSFITVADTSLNDSAPDSGDTTVTITLATGWPSSGLCLIDGIPMTFTRSSLVLTVPALVRDFDDGDDVQLAYAVPSDYWRTQSLFVDGNEYMYQRRGDDENVTSRHFALYDDYIVLPKAGPGSEQVTLHYYKKPTDTLSTSSTMDIAEAWDLFIVYSLVAYGHGCLYDNQRQILYADMAKAELKKARSHFARMDASRNNMFIPGF